MIEIGDVAKVTVQDRFKSRLKTFVKCSTLQDRQVYIELLKKQISVMYKLGYTPVNLDTSKLWQHLGA